MTRAPRFPFAHLLFLVVVLLATGPDRVRADLADEFLQCTARASCGLVSVCSFALPADPQRCAPGACAPLTGHIMRVDNGLARDATLAWDANDGSGGANATHGGSAWVAAHGSRYFDTQLAGPHTVRLRLDREVLTTAAARWETQCAPNDACHYLLRTCFDQHSARCTAYARHCGGFGDSVEEAARRQRCIPNCLTTFDHYRDAFAPLGAEFDVYTAIAYDPFVQAVAWHVGNGTNVTAVLLAALDADAAQAARLGGGSVVLIVLGTLVVVVGAVYVLWLFFARRIRWHRAQTFGADDDDDTDMDGMMY